MPEKIRYRRLAGARWGSGMRGSVRIAPDHLLVTEGQTGLIEQYRRFYFADIQAFIICKTSQWLVFAIVWLFFLLVSFVAAAGLEWSWIVDLFVLGPWALLLLLTLAFGPNCNTYLQTAVQLERLPALRRVRRTRRALAVLRPLIAEAQSGLSNIATAIPGPAVKIETAPFLPPASQTPALSAPEIPGSPAELSLVHLATFVLTALSAALAFVELQLPSTAFYTFFLVCFGVSAILAIVALVRQGPRAVHRGAVVIIWILALGNVLGGVICNTIYAMIHATTRLPARGTPRSATSFNYPNFTPYLMRHLPGFDYVLLIYAVVALFLAILGLIFTFIKVPAKIGPPPLPPTS